MGQAACALTLIALAAAAPLAAQTPAPQQMTIADGPFQPTWDSLQQYECPAWFRDAKFGIWAHWSAQCVPEQGDWYARGMYQQGSAQYDYHVEHYGHPSVFGFKDICRLWTADQWDPERLIGLYQRAGAQYFVALANHHCNFDCWDSTYQPWNSVNVGPHRDIVGTWARAARKAGLRFGVTVHSARSWDWYDVAHGSDATGPLAGVPYDGALTAADGKGKWWEGLDPADLYGPHGAARTPEAYQAYVRKWFLRTKDLVDKYHPDLLYFDDSQLPLGDAGMRIAAHYYNAGLKWHDGRLETVLTTKGMPPELRKTLVWDIERGISDRLEPYPWQTDTCIGVWHYQRDQQYKDAGTVIAMLVDIVSKNGNLLLNIPVRGNGTIDEREVAFLEDMAAWMRVNREAIFGTRPWIVFGEGPAQARGGQFNEGQGRPPSARDIRFTTKGGVLYAIALGWPESGTLTIRSLAKVPGARGRITRVELLGDRGELRWTHDERGLTIVLPSRKPCEHAVAFRIEGRRLDRFRPDRVPAEAVAIAPDANGNVALDTDTVELHGEQVQVEVRAGQPDIGFWDRAGDWVSWQVRLPAAATYEVTAQCAAAAGPTRFVLQVGGRQLVGAVPQSADWDTYSDVALGRVDLPAGQHAVSIRAEDAATWRPLNLRRVTLTKVP